LIDGEDTGMAWMLQMQRSKILRVRGHHDEAVLARVGKVSFVISTQQAGVQRCYYVMAISF
jgi:hypothetical protein